MIPTNYQVLAIYNLYPSVGYLRDEIAYDINDNEVAYDLDAVNVKAAELQAAEVAAQQASEAAKASALSKLSSLGLTDAEIKALTGN